MRSEKNIYHNVLEKRVISSLSLERKCIWFVTRLVQSDRIGGKMEIRLEKPALNNFKAYGWQNEKPRRGFLK